MALIIPAHGTCEKNERVFCSSSRYGEKPLSVFKNSFSFAQNPLRKKTGQNWKNNGFVKMGEGGFGEVSGIPDPP
jgi:hypothetical protein